MITLYRTSEGKLGKEIEQKLCDIVIAHKVQIISSLKEVPFDAGPHSLPLLLDNGNLISGEEALLQHLEKLKKLMADWDRFQSDACFLDDDGTTC